MMKSWPVFMFLVLLSATGVSRADGGVETSSLLTGNQSATFENAMVTDDVIRITPDKTKIVRLDQDAVSVVVANPDHASVILDSPRVLIVMPRQPGTTSFTVLNNKGETILERTVIVSSLAKPRYVRVRRVCSGQDSSCVPVAYFYCPDSCYEVSPVVPTQGQTPPPIISGGSTSGEPDQSPSPDETSPAPAEESAPTEPPSGEGQ